MFLSKRFLQNERKTNLLNQLFCNNLASNIGEQNKSTNNKKSVIPAQVKRKAFARSTEQYEKLLY